MIFPSIASAVTALVLLTESVNAMPKPQPPKPYTPARDLSKLAKLFPASDLPAPPANMELKYVALGLGTQNYTCTGDASAAPGTTGAVATLYDIGSSLNNDPWAKWKIPSVSPLAYSLSDYPTALSWSLKLQGYDHVIGHHYFAKINGVNTPTFSMDQLDQPCPAALVAKINETNAPDGACPSSNGLPAIKWLYLKDTLSQSSGGIDTVYRVETAGGNKPATCAGMPPSWEAKYAAQYWIYGPKK